MLLTPSAWGTAVSAYHGWVESPADWSAALSPCTTCGSTSPVVTSLTGTCALCWASETGADPDHALGQAIATEALILVETAPEQVAGCVERLRELAEHATRPALTAVLADAARDLEVLAAESGGYT